MDRNSHYTRGRVLLKVALYSFMSTPLKFPSHQLLIVFWPFLKDLRVAEFVHYINLSCYMYVVLNARPREIRGQNISYYIRGRTILKVALYENSGAIFSHYIGGRVVI